MKKLTTNMVLVIAFLSFSITSCKKETKLNSSPSDPNQFYAKIDGIDLELIYYLGGEVHNVLYNESTPDSTSDLHSYGAGLALFDSVFNPIQEGKVSFGSIRTLLGENPEWNEFESFFSVGQRKYDSQLKDGVKVEIIIDGVLWSTALGSEEQANSTFEISKTRSGGISPPGVKIEANYQCSMYDQNGNSAILTNGFFRGGYFY